MPTVVLDARVLIPATLRDTLLRIAQDGLYQARWSSLILDEVERNLVQHGMTSETQAASLRRILERTFESALVPQERFESLIEVMPNEPKDRHVLAAAVACGAQVIVTLNLRDFPSHVLRMYAVEAQSPDEFLESLYSQDPEGIRPLFAAQVAALQTPPLSRAAVLANLALTAPRFAALVQSL